MLLPKNRFEAELLKSFRSKKSIYVRFDLNDYSFPHTAANKDLTLAASDTRIRILHGKKVIATHRRSYGRGELVEAPEHTRALLRLRRKAQSSSAMQQLAARLPEAGHFIECAFDKGESPRGLVRKLLLLLDDYGKSELRAAICLALERHTPRLSSLAWLLKKRRAASKQKRPLPLTLCHRPELTELVIQPQDPEVYDELFRSNESEDD